MRIISHRGYWKDFFAESNKEVAFERSFNLGFGTETDLRDIKGTIVISHDMPSGGEITFEELLKIMDGRNLPLALNIKADGLANEIEMMLKKYGHTNYFTFDMSIPDLYYQIHNTELNIFTGCSDINREPPLLTEAKGIWLDAFRDFWYTKDNIMHFLKSGKKVCIVSEDLHSRDNELQWNMLRDEELLSNDDLILCTNYPEDAKDFLKIR